MALMTWNDSFSVGVKAMDEQHKALVKSLNDLHAAMLEKHEKEVTGALLKTLIKYTRDHFTAEEAFLTRSKYPNLEAHRAKHKDLTGQVEQFVHRYEKGELALTVDLLMFLREWLVKHIQREDKEYGPWLNQQGVR